MNYPIDDIRRDFPILNEKINGHPLVYFDNAATTQKPRQVIDAITSVYSHCNANVHRGVHRLSRQATENHENARKRVADFIGADAQEVLFTAGGTESLNIIAYSLGEAVLNDGDHVVVTAMEHHSNFVPWQQLALRKGARFTVIPLTKTGEIDRKAFSKALSLPGTKIVSIAHASNVLGTINPVKELVEEIHRYGAYAVVDGAQAVAHIPVNVRELDADFYTFSSHKMYGPTGIGVFFGKRNLLEAMPPVLYGGEMISKVTPELTTFAEIPYKFEAGTPNFVGSVALSKAIDYLECLGMENIRFHEQQITSYCFEKLNRMPEIEIIGRPEHREPVISFVPKRVHPYDLGLFLDEQGVALRSGHHCAEPLLDSLSLTSTLRASFGLYNTFEEVDVFIEALHRSLAMLS